MFNQHEATRECIESVKQNTTNYELVVVDNGSSPCFDCNTIRNETNLGFPAAVNQGIQAAKGDIIIILNNDTIVTPGWSERLISYLDRFGIIGPVSNYVAGMQRTIIPTYTNEQELYQRAAQWQIDHAGEVKEVNWIIGFCMAFKKSLFDEVGDFDETHWPCCGEEIDFCLRAREKGYKVGYTSEIYIHHEGSQTFRAMSDIDYNEICERNEKHLTEKWGPDVLNQEIPLIPKDGLRLNLGCGYRKLEGFVNIDNRESVDPDLLCDVIPGLPALTGDLIIGLPYDDNSVDMVRAYDFLEHIPIGKVVPVMNEIYRVLKPGGIFESSTPSTDGRGAFQDPTHVSFWNHNSWWYYSIPEYRHLYGITADFEIVKIEDINSGNGIIHTHVIARKRIA